MLPIGEAFCGLSETGCDFEILARVRNGRDWRYCLSCKGVVMLFFKIWKEMSLILDATTLVEMDHAVQLLLSGIRTNDTRPQRLVWIREAWPMNLIHYQAVANIKKTPCPCLMACILPPELQGVSTLRYPILGRWLRIIIPLIASGPCQFPFLLLQCPLLGLCVGIDHLVAAPDGGSHAGQSTSMLLARVRTIMSQLTTGLPLSRVPEACMDIARGGSAEG